MLLRPLAQTPKNKRCLPIPRQILRQRVSDSFRGSRRFSLQKNTRIEIQKQILEPINDNGDTRLHLIAKRDQELVKKIPDLISVEEFGMGGPMMVVGRETSLPSGSVD